MSSQNSFIIISKISTCFYTHTFISSFFFQESILPSSSLAVKPVTTSAPASTGPTKRSLKIEEWKRRKGIIQEYSILPTKLGQEEWKQRNGVIQKCFFLLTQLGLLPTCSRQDLVATISIMSQIPRELKLALPTETYFRKTYSSDSYIFLTARRHYHVTEYQKKIAHHLNKKKRQGSRVAHNF